MTVKEPPDSQGSEIESEPSNLDSEDLFTTQSIDLDKLYAGVVTDSGSFDLRQLERTSVFRLLDALPTPAFLIDQSHLVTFMNASCGKIGPGYKRLNGQPFSAIFATPDGILQGRSLLEKVFEHRKPLVARALVGAEGSLIWARIHLHSLRMSDGRVVLALIEDLTSEKRQVLFEEKYRKGLEESRGQLEQRVKERTGELVRANERLHEEILVRQKAEESLARELTKFHALYDLAVAMTADRSLDDNLSLAVEKSRELLLGDSSYIALRDEAAGDVYMHTLLGVNTDAFRRLRIPFGAGLGGKVASTGIGYIVEDYFQEIGPLLHDIVKAEGVISGVAVPIQIGQTNLGVLYVFNRTKTKFSKSDLDTLSLLGNLAAVEIARKRSAEDLTKAHEELEQRVEERTRELRRTNARLLHEIGERKRSEEALQRSETKYRNILETITDGYHEVDLVGNMLLVNDSLCDIFGYPREEVLGLNYRQLLEPSTVGQVYAAYNQVYKTGQPNPGFSFEIKRKDRTKRNVSVSISLIRDSSDKPIGFRGIFRDITERRRLEEQLRQAAKMEAIGRLAGGVAHDFNNLLTAVIGYSHLIMQQVAENSAIHEKLTQITRAAERAAELTSQLLAFSRKQVLEVKVLNLNDVIAGLEGMLRRIIGEDIQLETVFQPSLGSVRVDPVQMEQILMNLVINSRDAMPAGGGLKVETANVFLDEEYCQSHDEVEVGPHVMIAVYDTGHGMDEDTLNRIFDPFFTTKEKGVGTGLGLSTVYGIIRQHQGHITVNSARGQGTTFRVFFPRVDATPEKDSRAKSTGPHHYGTETILVVEDEQIVRNLACEALAMLGYATLSARDPDQAISICDTHKEPIHLLVSDLVLPQMDGSSLYKKLSPRRPEMKVLYVSGYTENFIVHQGILDPGVNFLAKPFTVESLAKKVREVLDESP